MSYQGGPPQGPGQGFPYGHTGPRYYVQEGQHPYLQHPQARPSWDGSSASVNIPHNSYMPIQNVPMQQMNQMRQFQDAQTLNQAAYQQQRQLPQNQVYLSTNVHPGPAFHGSAPALPQPHTQPQYAQYQARPPPVAPSQPHVQHSSIPQQPFVPRPSPIVRVEVPQYQSPPTEPAVSLKNSSPKSQPISKQDLLIALAEEYFAAAHRIAPTVASNMSKEVMEQYQSFIATGLGCLEAMFKKMKLPPRLEARVRLRYASVLYEETENHMVAETTLSQGIILCEQNRYLDLKYSMQVLLAQLVFVKNPKASLKSLERHCADTEAYRHYAWNYVFRLLRASLLMKTNRASDFQAGSHELQRISSDARDRGDQAIVVFSSVLEVLAHLSAPNADAGEQVQTALASAWAYQLEVGSKTPQLLVLTHILDVTCSLIYGKPSQTETKQSAMEQVFRGSEWSTATGSSEIFPVPIQSASSQAQLVSPETSGILGLSQDSQQSLMVSFLDNNDTYALIRLLSGIALLHNNCVDGKALQYLKQGLESAKDSNKSPKASAPLPTLIGKSQWRRVIICYLLIYSIFCHASVSDWNAVRTDLESLDKSIGLVDEASRPPLSLFHTYLSGVHSQATGNLQDALHIFRHPSLQLSDQVPSNLQPEAALQQELALLSSLNVLWLLQASPSHDRRDNASMIAKLEAFCTNHRNADIDTALKLVKATVKTEPPTPGVRIKTFLASSLDAARATSNKQFLCITLSVMCSKFFVGVVGDQAGKAAKAAAHQAKRARNLLWMSVTQSMLANNLELQANHTEARVATDEAKRLISLAFPDSL